MAGMSEVEPYRGVHQVGEEPAQELGFPAPHRVETMGGTFQVIWEEDPGISPQGLLT